ncbi:unnamed protein product [Oppiella nova]|uniref:Uncharacterized protein n=1 Tax=Oppiella nova TaxID=334625 RepID=A0A7R9LND8_9ACAR|nr:unnamed protein product [Oppiella nova]CAG2164760.1 unnamed protein product [Oppiella nova]
METSEPSTSTTSTSNSSANCSPTSASSSGGSGDTPGQSVDEFLNTGRTGRRNAMPDILEEKSSQLSTSDLPNELQKLNFNGI